jgi:MraZ protein
MFLGQYTYRIDTKGRMTVPARFRELLDQGAFISQGFERNLMVLTDTSFQLIVAKTNEMSITDPTARSLKRMIYSSADRVDIDRAGRILIPQFLRDFAQLNGDAAVVGVGDYFEIWSPKVWEAQSSELMDPDENAKRFAALDLSSGVE